MALAHICQVRDILLDNPEKKDRNPDTALKKMKTLEIINNSVAYGKAKLKHSQQGGGKMEDETRPQSLRHRSK